MQHVFGQRQRLCARRGRRRHLPQAPGGRDPRWQPNPRRRHRLGNQPQQPHVNGFAAQLPGARIPHQTGVPQRGHCQHCKDGLP